LETSSAVLLERLPESLQMQHVPSAGAELSEGFSLDDHLLAIESGLVRQALLKAEGDRAAAARLLGITPRSLRYLMSKHGVEQPA
jgi:two-component system response regulator PilR (NtrC family)